MQVYEQRIKIQSKNAQTKNHFVQYGIKKNQINNGQSFKLSKKYIFVSGFCFKCVSIKYS